jgi:hypothetical protein
MTTPATLLPINDAKSKAAKINRDFSADSDNGRVWVAIVVPAGNGNIATIDVYDETGAWVGTL